jgi:hypothetical protein
LERMDTRLNLVCVLKDKEVIHKAGILGKLRPDSVGMAAPSI